MPAHLLDQVESASGLEVLGAIGLLHAWLDLKTGDAVRQAQKQGATWMDIGARLGISKQAAWKAYHEAGEDEPDY